jgi:hypothetical protein
MGASKRAVCAHAPNQVELVFYLGDHFAGRKGDAYTTHAIHWCSACGAVSRYELDAKTGTPHEVWRTPGR